MTRLYGISKILGFPCICYGTKGYFFTIRWSKKDKWFKVYRGYTVADDVIFNTVNCSKWFFVGIIKTTDTLRLWQKS